MSARVAVVTGGASGLGRIFALRMAAQGIRVGIVDRDREALTTVASESSNVHPVRCDVSSSEELGAALTEIESTLGTIDRIPGTEAKAVMWLRRMSPALLWKIIRQANR
jgi:NAD(P)-dependent dehydrogenase (short-subunit alcohol dehydrogenase family)